MILKKRALLMRKMPAFSKRTYQSTPWLIVVNRSVTKIAEGK